MRFHHPSSKRNIELPEGMPFRKMPTILKELNSNIADVTILFSQDSTGKIS